MGLDTKAVVGIGIGVSLLAAVVARYIPHNKNGDRAKTSSRYVQQQDAVSPYCAEEGYMTHPSPLSQ